MPISENENHQRPSKCVVENIAANAGYLMRLVGRANISCGGVTSISAEVQACIRRGGHRAPELLEAMPRASPRAILRETPRDAKSGARPARYFLERRRSR